MYLLFMQFLSPFLYLPFNINFSLTFPLSTFFFLFSSLFSSFFHIFPPQEHRPDISYPRGRSYFPKYTHPASSKTQTGATVALKKKKKDRICFLNKKDLQYRFAMSEILEHSFLCFFLTWTYSGSRFVLLR